MRSRCRLLIALATASLFVPWNTAIAYDFQGSDPTAQRCYGRAMVGYDSVINARLGIPPEHALSLSQDLRSDAAEGERYSTQLLKTILDAYLWNGSAHDYAVTVFLECATTACPC